MSVSCRASVKFPIDIVELICDYAATYTLASWVKPSWITEDYLSENPNAIDMLEENPDMICWLYLSRNPRAMHLLRANPDKIDWMRLSENPAAIDMLIANPDKINWIMASGNDAVIEVLLEDANVKNPRLRSPMYDMEKYIDAREVFPGIWLDWEIMQGSTHPRVIELLQKTNIRDLDWASICGNRLTMNIVLSHPEMYTYWAFIAKNSHPEAVELIRDNSHKMDNGSVNISSNPAIFELTVPSGLFSVLLRI